MAASLLSYSVMTCISCDARISTRNFIFQYYQFMTFEPFFPEYHKKKFLCQYLIHNLSLFCQKPSEEKRSIDRYSVRRGIWCETTRAEIVVSLTLAEYCNIIQIRVKRLSPMNRNVTEFI